MSNQHIPRVPAFPLQWPLSVPRTKPEEKGDRFPFKVDSWNSTLWYVRDELKKLGAVNEVISTNQPLRADGEPYASFRKIDDPGVAVYFVLDGVHVCFPCDRWSTIGENLRAIQVHIENLRRIQRLGVGKASQMFAGYKALTATAGEGEDPFLVLGVAKTATEDQIRAAHRALAIKAHPDAGGSSDQMARINSARDRALAQRTTGA